jgi:hypothetical protein
LIDDWPLGILHASDRQVLKSPGYQTARCHRLTKGARLIANSGLGDYVSQANNTWLSILRGLMAQALQLACRSRVEPALLSCMCSQRLPSSNFCEEKSCRSILANTAKSRRSLAFEQGTASNSTLGYSISSRWRDVPFLSATSGANGSWTSFQRSASPSPLAAWPFAVVQAMLTWFNSPLNVGLH